MSTPDLINLREGQVLDGVDLTNPEAEALNASELVSVEPSGRAWRVTAAHVVGAVRVGRHVVRVQPKIGAVKALRLLARAHAVHHLRLDDAPLDLGVDPDLHAVLALLFAEEARRAFAQGPLRGYRTEEQSLSVLRGRLRLRDQELRRFGLLIPLEVIVDEWTADTDDNRRILAATRRLLLLPAVPEAVRASLTRVDRLLAEVTLPAPGSIPAWTPTRLNARMHQLLRLADLVLAGQTFEHTVGEVRAQGFVLRMEKLFEDLVARLLSELDDEVRLSPQAGYRLDDGNWLRIRPDLVFIGDGGPVAVADTKYKILNEKKKLRNEDAYQLLAYCTRLRLTEGHLIYCVGVDDGDDQIPPAHRILGSSVTLRIHRIDLHQPIESVEQQVRFVRDAITPQPEASVTQIELLRPEHMRAVPS